MEQLNRIEIRGIIGSVYVKDFANAKVANFSVATSIGYKSSDGSPVIETTWHRVVAWEGNGIHNLHMLQKGMGVHVTGRIRMQRYTAADGSDRTAYEILARTLELEDQR